MMKSFTRRYRSTQILQRLHFHKPFVFCGHRTFIGTVDFFQTLAAALVTVFQIENPLGFDDAMNVGQKTRRIVHLMEHVQGINNIGTMILDYVRLIAEQNRNHVGQEILFSSEAFHLFPNGFLALTTAVE